MAVDRSVIRKDRYENGTKAMPRKYAPGTDPWYNVPRVPGLKDLMTETGLSRGLCNRALKINHGNIEGARRWLKLKYWKRPESIPVDEDGKFDVEEIYSKIV